MGIPIRIYQDNEFLIECSNIQQAAKWLKQYTGDTKYRYAHIQNGYCYKKPWIYKGVQYTFEADEIIASARRLQLGKDDNKSSPQKNITELIENSVSPVFNREEYIKYLSENLFDLLYLKNKIKDSYLRKYHLKSKSIGDDLYFLTESYFRKQGLFKGKYHMADFMTFKAENSLRTKDKTVLLVYEHMVPKNIYINRIVKEINSGNLTEDFVYNLLNKYYYVCTVTKEEDKKLSSTKMPGGWDEINPFYRYDVAGIEYIPNK